MISINKYPNYEFTFCLDNTESWIVTLEFTYLLFAGKTLGYEKIKFTKNSYERRQ